VNDAERVLILVGGERDGALTRRLLERDGLSAFLCHGVEQLCTEIEAGAGAALLAEEALTKTAVECVRQSLDHQAVWSDLPIVVFSSAGEPRARLLVETIHQLGNVTFLDRPVQVRSMLASVHAAIRSRRRQYETRRAIESRDSFLAMLGHELRNPLAAIRLAIEVLEKREGAADGQREHQIIGRQSRHLSRIVDELLDVARVTHGKIVLKPERLNLADSVRGAYDLIEPNAREHLASFVLTVDDDPIYVDGDPQRLEQVFTNLFTNAIKYTPQGGSATVHVRAEADRAIVSVTDTGIGLAPEMRERVFEIFTQAERSLDRSQGGIGLGLSLVRGVVLLHGGEVHAESEGLGKGSSFVVTLPRSVATAAHTNGNGASPAFAHSTRKRVVVVEDSEDIRELLVELLESFGHEVKCADAGPAGLETILATTPDVAFVDIGLPEMDGFEVARRVRAAASTVRLVAMTGYGQLEDRQKAAAAGFDDHLTKPVGGDAIVRAIAAVDSGK